MALTISFARLIHGDLFNTLLPDFVLGFVFFSSVIYAVLSRRFGQQRPAVAMSAALGMALTIGLVWWEYVNDFSIKNLGSIAAGFAVIVLGGVLYQAIRHVGGTWSGAAIAIGACLLVGGTLGFAWPVDAEIVQTLTIVTLTGGMIAFLLHRHGHGHGHGLRGPHGTNEPAEIRHDMSNVYDDYKVAHRLRRGFQHLRKKADHLHERPDDAHDVLTQLKRMLPAEGWLTERLARLREKAHLARKGHITRITEIQQDLTKLPSRARLRAGKELTARYKELQLDQRLERLDKACAENELRIRNLTLQAKGFVSENDQQALSGVLDTAAKLQRHNEGIFKLIDQTERRLMRVAKEAAKAQTEEKKI